MLSSSYATGLAPFALEFADGASDRLLVLEAVTVAGCAERYLEWVVFTVPCISCVLPM